MKVKRAACLSTLQHLHTKTRQVCLHLFSNRLIVSTTPQLLSISVSFHFVKRNGQFGMKEGWKKKEMLRNSKGISGVFLEKKATRSVCCTRVHIKAVNVICRASEINWQSYPVSEQQNLYIGIYLSKHYELGKFENFGRPSLTLGFSYRASSMLYNKSYQLMPLLWYFFIYDTVATTTNQSAEQTHADKQQSTIRTKW